MQESVKFLRLNLLSSDQLHDLAKFDMSVHSQIELHTLLYFLVIGKPVKLIKIHAVHPFLLGSSTGPSFANFCDELIRYENKRSIPKRFLHHQGKRPISKVCIF